MKKKLRIQNFNGSIVEVNCNVRNLMHFAAQRTYRANVVQDKRFKKDKYKDKCIRDYM